MTRKSGRKEGATPCEIYVRNSGGQTLLHNHGDLRTLSEVMPDESPIAFVELSVRAEWITDPEAKRRFEEAGGMLHVRIPIHATSGFS